MNNAIRKEIKEAIALAMETVYNLQYGVHTKKQKEFLDVAIENINKLKLKLKTKPKGKK